MKPQFQCFINIPPFNRRASKVVLVVKNLPARAGDLRDAGVICGWGRSLGGGNGNPLRYSCLENPMDGGAWWGYSPWCCKESDTTEQGSLVGYNLCAKLL